MFQRWRGQDVKSTERVKGVKELSVTKPGGPVCGINLIPEQNRVSFVVSFSHKRNPIVIDTKWFRPWDDVREEKVY